MPRAQGMIQRLEQFTSKLSDSDEQQILRLRHGKIRKGAYKGTKKGRFKHWMAKPFLSEEKKAARKQYLAEVTAAESKALAKELCADISRRTPVPYEVDRQVTVRDVKLVLEASSEDRANFTRTVRQFVSTSATPSQLRNKPIEAARKRLEQSMMDRGIRRHDQIKELHKEALQLLDEQKRTKKSRRKPLTEGGAPLELKNLRKLKREIGSLIEEKMLSLALLHEAHEYAMREQMEGAGTTPQKPVSDTRRYQLLEDFVQSAKPQNAARKSVTLLAAEHMLNNGYKVDIADLPSPDSQLPEETQQRQKQALANEIKRLKDCKTPWANEVAKLLEAGKYKEARVVEKLARDSEAMSLLGGIRDVYADNAWDKFLAKQRSKIKSGKKLALQKPGEKRIRGRGPRLEKIRPQTFFDKVRPRLGDHTEAAFNHAAQMIGTPTEYDGNIQSKEAIVEQTLGMLQSKYRELAQDHNAFQLQEIRDYLEKNIHDRQVEVTEPVVRMKRPLKDVPFSPVSASSSPEDELHLSPTPSFSGDSDAPEFDLTKLETGSATSPDSGTFSAFDREEEIKALDVDIQELDEEVFEETRTGLDSLSELVDAEKQKLRTKSTSELDKPSESSLDETKPAKPRSASLSGNVQTAPTPLKPDDSES